MTTRPVLAFDTSGPFCAAALSVGSRQVIRVDDMARGQAEHLMPMLTEMLQTHDLTWSDLGALGVGVGPGNFTGIRIAVSAARGLALGLAIPAVGVSVFDTTQMLSGDTAVVVPGPQGKVYAFDPVTMRAPTFDQPDPGRHAAWSNDYTPHDHIAALLTITAERASTDMPAPKPLYVKPADAAPPREQAPVMLP